MYYNNHMKNMSILNNKIDNYNTEELSNHVQELYDIGKMNTVWWFNVIFTRFTVDRKDELICLG